MDAERWQRLSPLLDVLLELDPEARAQQLEILRSSLALIHEADEGGVLIDLPLTWPEPFWYFEKASRESA